jgi:hypothetical protein
VTAPPLAPVIPSSGAPATRLRAWPSAARRLPLASPLPVPSVPEDVVYGIARLDASGRICERAVITALGWVGGDRLTFTADAGVVTARRDPGGMVTLPASTGTRTRTNRTRTRRTKSRTSSPGPGPRSGPVRLRGPATARSRRARQHRPLPPGASFPVPPTREASRHPDCPQAGRSGETRVQAGTAQWRGQGV